jgi:hypothetical protein
MPEPPDNLLKLPVVVRAETAMRQAGAAVIADHLRTGDPLVIWRDGKVVLVPPEEWIASLTPEKSAAG